MFPPGRYGHTPVGGLGQGFLKLDANAIRPANPAFAGATLVREASHIIGSLRFFADIPETRDKYACRPVAKSVPVFKPIVSA